MTESTKPTILLLSSDLRRKYAEDILTAIALPPGSLLQFRYGSSYVSSDLQRQIANGEAVGCRALVAFVAGVENPGPFLLPVRLATVVQADTVGDMFVLQLRVDAYADLSDLPRTSAGLTERASGWIAKLKERNDGLYFPATTRFPDLAVHQGEDAAQQWLGIAQRLALTSTFEHSYFLRIDSPVSMTDKPLAFDALGRLTLSDRRAGKLRVTFYSEKYSDTKVRTLACATDGKFLRISSDSTYDVAHRYDSVEFWLQPSTTSFNVLSRVTINLSAVEAEHPSSNLATKVQLPILVQRSRSWLLARLSSSAAGALLVALPAILGQGVSLRLRISAALAGAVLLSYSTMIATRSDR